MKKLIRSPLLLLLLGIPVSTNALLLDCDINADRIYTCIEVGATRGNAETPDDKQSYSAEYQRFVEAAKQACVYHKPRRRTAGKNTGGALRSEELKSARLEYEQCVTDKARALWREHKSGIKAGPTGE